MQVPSLVSPLTLGVPIRGVIGADVFLNCVVTVNYQTRKVTLSNPAAFQYAGKGAAFPLTFDASRRRPIIFAEADGIRGRFLLDTGSSGALTLFGGFVRAHGLLKKYAAKFHTTEEGTVTGIHKIAETREPALTLGRNILKQVPAELQAPEEAERNGADGSIGGDILCRFTVTFDYTHHLVYFEPNAQYAIPFSRNRSGLVPLYDKTGWVTHIVQAHSPAERAGLRAGDHITQIEGRDAAQVDVLQFMAMTQQSAGTALHLTVQRGKTICKITLLLADYD